MGEDDVKRSAQNYDRRWHRIAVVASMLAAMSASGAANAQDDADIAGDLQDAIVGLWTGTAAQPERDPFDVRLTFVSPKGGISRYPGDPPCGGMLSGDRKGDNYEFVETITYGGTDEKTDGCLSGTMSLTIEGDTMKYSWATQYNGEDYTATGELKRQKGGKKR
jgi:hypothetical protein